MEAESTKRISAALADFTLDDHHLRVWDPNDLVAMGFPSELVLSATKPFKAEEGYVLFHHEKDVEEFLGVEHHNFIWKIAEALDLDVSGAFQFNGRGFQMREVIRVIETWKDAHRASK